MSQKIAYILGTSRSDGNTRRLLELINAKAKAPIFDLAKLNISYFDYEGRNLSDDFIPIIESLRDVSTIGFVSPMYWYTVSAQLKTFIDRLSDLLGPRKDLGNMLRGKGTFLLATGSTEKQIAPGMVELIKRTSEYMGMVYRGAHYVHVQTDLVLSPGQLKGAEAFVEEIIHE
jgi:multimeric flavodoxin WrbA